MDLVLDLARKEDLDSDLGPDLDLVLELNAGCSLDKGKIFLPFVGPVLKTLVVLMGEDLFKNSGDELFDLLLDLFLVLSLDFFRFLLLPLMPVPVFDSFSLAAIGEALIGEALIGEALIGEALIGEILIGDALTGDALVGEALLIGKLSGFLFLWVLFGGWTSVGET